ncbi:histidine--tRNA ligase [Alkaliphilus peptidifermentans]|uniref:Histidine--tRNA ligase n=1 Tax=Alkaliphilus peptidifermentans DSM 18978 TaxID=1120976 RepID=A0A1G5L4I0_9FIRM|nr:histidine--tRNA ligase [Alkaliphilus peptidifermentans]SCZ07180.1 histidyl-tRNA synthetase [Alkaliphilus peptidifermentans DSM 18978]
MKVSTLTVKGTFDILPNDMTLREWMKNTVIEIYKQGGFQQIETPSIENLELLTKSDGGENLNLLFKILKRGEKLDLEKENLTDDDLCDLGLRYDLTLPLSRFYTNNREELPNPFKAIQTGWVWRAEKPQKGRFRQFIQCDIDIIGEKSDIAEIELITTTAKALQALSFDNFTVKINDRRLLKSLIISVGFEEEAIESICITLDKMDKVGKEGVQKELLAKGYDEAKVVDLLIALDDLKTLDGEVLEKYNVEEEVLQSLKKVIEVVEKQSKGLYNIEFDVTLIRGMGYYTGQIFEVVSNDLGSSIAGGGRYDKMIGRFQKEDVPAVGFSIGFERIFTILKERNFAIPNTTTRIALLFDSNEDVNAVLEQANKLREKGNIVSIFPKNKKFSKQINNLKKQLFDAYGICNEGEVSEIVSLKEE